VVPVGVGGNSPPPHASPLQNRLLDEADNAALALALGGQGPVVFVESVHGYTTATGLAALPARFQWALILLGLSGLVLIAARWPRMGPPEPPEEPRFPPRRAYVDALAATLAKTRDRAAAVESIRSAARERLARRAALARDAGDEAWFEAARAAGLDHEEARALVDGDGDGIAAGRALARLSGGRERSRA
jgi:pimeloyl-ACP methyl ester carboxylesterase